VSFQQPVLIQDLGLPTKTAPHLGQHADITSSILFGIFPFFCE
jgi:hypothetical protein